MEAQRWDSPRSCSKLPRGLAGLCCHVELECVRLPGITVENGSCVTLEQGDGVDWLSRGEALKLGFPACPTVTPNVTEPLVIYQVISLTCYLYI